MTEPTARIRWEAGAEASMSAWLGFAGAVFAFQIIKPVFRSDPHTLVSNLPGQLQWKMDGDPEALKKGAEAWLSEFVTSLGAVFPDALVADLRSRADELEMTVAHNASHERDKHLFAAGLKRGADLIERGDQPEVSEAPAPSVPSGTGKE